MATYLDLLNEVLLLTESAGATDVTAVTKVALRRSLSYISRKARLNGLVRSSTYTWQTGDSLINLTTSPGFNVSDYEYPYFMTVGDGETYLMYAYIDFHEWLSLKSVSRGYREGLDAGTRDARPAHTFTVNFDNFIEVSPIETDQVATLYYFKAPAPYADLGVPEISDAWRDLLVEGAARIVRFFIEHPAEVLDSYQILSGMDSQIDSFKMHLDGIGYKRRQMTLGTSYAPERSSLRVRY